MSIEEIEAAISQLSPDDLARLAAWFIEFRVGAGDLQLDADVKGGKLDQLARQAKEDSPPKRD
jgi:cytochrome c553